jgi:hypothetical protein
MICTLRFIVLGWVSERSWDAGEDIYMITYWEMRNMYKISIGNTFKEESALETWLSERIMLNSEVKKVTFLCLTKQNDVWGVQVWLHIFLTSALLKLSSHKGEIAPDTHWIGGRLGPNPCFSAKCWVKICTETGSGSCLLFLCQSGLEGWGGE